MSTVSAGDVRPPRTKWLTLIKRQKEIFKWKLRGKPAPPPHSVKVAIISRLARLHACRSLIETGTFKGDMVARTRHLFERIYTIEIDSRLHAAACVRFQDDPAVFLLHGDSTYILPELVDQLGEPALFWLDGHYSGGETGKGDLETPIQREVECILQPSQLAHVLLIDDARLFDGTGDYPTLSSLRERLASLRPDYSFAIENDIIRFEPPTLG